MSASEEQIVPTGLTAGRIKTLARYDTPTIANALESLLAGSVQFIGPEVRAVTPLGGPIVGVAVTATMTEQWGGKFDHLEPWLRFLEEIERTALPVVAVFQDDSRCPGRQAMIGEGMSRAMRAAGAVAAICSGSIRDVAALREMAFPALAAGLVADRGRIRFHRYQVPVEIAGMTVMPGDLIHADENGAVVIPADRVADVFAAAGQVSAKEARLFAMFAEPAFRVAGLYEYYREELAAARAAR
jgi:regulator of RNase E activity RraA